MSQENVDVRIVEAKFDSKDFEKGVNKTLKKLDELKNQLSMKDTKKSITDLAKQTSEGVNKIDLSLTALQKRLTSF